MSSSTPAWRATACRCGGAFVEPPMTIGPPWYLKVYAAMRKMYTSPRYTNDETRCVSVHAHEHALHAIDAQHVTPAALPLEDP